MGYGSLRDLIIGVTLVLADGTIAKSGGKVVKNVAGYDLPKLATGALGTLGVITRAVLPAASSAAEYADADDRRRMMRDAMQRAGLVDSAMRSLRPAAVQVRNGHVDILLEGTLEGIAAQESAIKKFGAAREGSPEVWKARGRAVGRSD